jgi:1,4-alpha-glucan branching enzyme
MAGHREGTSPVIIPESELKAFLHNHQANPHGWLGMHPAKVKRKSGVVVRAFHRNAARCAVVELDAPGQPAWPMDKLADEGFFEVFIPGKKLFRHQLRYETNWGDIHQVYNAYSFLPSL